MTVASNHRPSHSGVSTMTDDNDSDIFGHLLDYQQTEEFQRDADRQLESEREARRPAAAKGQRVYRAKFPEFARMRSRAKQYEGRLLALQLGKCKWCGKPLNRKCEIDHIIPLTKGGTNAFGNLCVVHPRCNKKKGTKILR